MSRARIVPDAEKTATMLDLVHQMFPSGDGSMSLSHVVIDEVAPGTGWLGVRNRWADVLALSVWPSKGLTIAGFEIKASRADLKRELADIKKHEALAQYCETWSLVVWDEAVLVDGIPDSWGIYVTELEDGERELVQKHKPAKREPQPWTKELTCSLVRNAHVQSPGAAYVARAAAAAYGRGHHEGQDEGRRQIRAHLDQVCVVLWGENRWNWPSRDPEEICKLVAERLTQFPLSPAGTA